MKLNIKVSFDEKFALKKAMSYIDDNIKDFGKQDFLTGIAQVVIDAVMEKIDVKFELEKFNIVKDKTENEDK